MCVMFFILINHDLPIIYINPENIDVWIIDNFNTLKPRQNGRYFPDHIFKCIFLNENV